MNPSYAQNLAIIKPVSDKVFTLVSIYLSRTPLVAYK
jgi:hypothetical protein